MDLETRNIEGKLYPYAVSIYDGIDLNFFYLSDYADSDDLLCNAIKSLMQRRYNGYSIYLHNFSRFDGIFLMKVLTELSSRINIIMRESNIISVKFYFGKYHIYFKDSYLMLPASLRKLAASFKVGYKGLFPYKFVNEVNLDYEGAVPELKYFDNVSESQYKLYCQEHEDRPWHLRSETEWYCNQDCLILYDILVNYSKEIYNLFRIYYKFIII